MEKKKFLKSLLFTPLIVQQMNLSALNTLTGNFTSSAKMPVLFIGHGHPMNAIYNNNFTRRLGALKTELPKPNAILVLSAHWQTRNTRISTNPWPTTIYDFGRFDDRLFRIKYEPEGQSEIARSVRKMISDPSKIEEDDEMGLDHGAWTILKHMYPEADIPVFQMSLAYNEGPQYHFELGRQIKALREKGVLIIGSGNIVHNLRELNWNSIDAAPYEWNIAFDEEVKKAIDNRHFKALINYKNFGRIAELSIPTNDHYLPMLYTLGLAGNNDEIEHIFEGYQFAGISMRCFKIG